MLERLQTKAPQELSIRYECQLASTEGTIPGTGLPGGYIRNKSLRGGLRFEEARPREMSYDRGEIVLFERTSQVFCKL